MSKLYVAIIVAELDVYGGTHKQVLRLAECLKRREIEYSIITGLYNPQTTYDGFDNLNVISLGKDIDKNGSLFRRLYERIKWQYNLFKKIPNETKVVNIHDNRLSIVSFLSKLTGKKVVWQINDLPTAFSVGNANKKKSRRYVKFLYCFWYRTVAKLVDLITVNVTKNKNRVEEHLRRHDAKVLYCGVDMSKDDFYLRKILNDINILSTGVFFRYRNYESLIKAVAKLSTITSKNVTLTIVGETKYDEEYVKELEKLAKEVGLVVNIKSRLSQSELVTLYDVSHIFAFLNLDQSWGLSVFEAASSSLPVVLSKSVGATELLDNVLGIELVEPLDIDAVVKALTNLLDDDVYVENSKSVFSAVRDMTWDTMYSEKLIDYFYEIQN